MEVMVVAFAIATALAALGIALFVMTRMLRVSPERNAWRTLRSTPGFRWVILGVSATLVFSLLHLSVLIPVLITTGGMVAMAVRLRK